MCRAATVSPSRRRLRRSARGPDDCPTTTCHRVSSGMLNIPPADRTDACGVSDALPSEGSTPVMRRDESLKSDPRKGNRSSRAWIGDQSKYGNRKYDIKMRYCNFILHAYSQMYDGPVHGHAPDTHAHRTTNTQDKLQDATRAYNAVIMQTCDSTIRFNVQFCGRGSL